MDLLGGAGDRLPDTAGGLVAGEGEGAAAAPGPGGAQHVRQERQGRAERGGSALAEVPEQQVGQPGLQDQTARVGGAFDDCPQPGIIQGR